MGGGGGGGVGIGPHAAGRPHPIGPSAWERGRNRLDRLGGVTASAPPRVEEEEEEEGPGGSPWGPRGAVTRLCSAAGRVGCETPRVSEGRRRGEGGTEGCKKPPEPYRWCPLRGHAWGRHRGVLAVYPPRPLVSSPPRRLPRSHAVGPLPPHLRPATPTGSLPSPHIHSRPPPLPHPTPRSVPSVPRVPRSHGAPRPETTGDFSREGHARPWGTKGTDPQTQVMPRLAVSPCPTLTVCRRPPTMRSDTSVRGHPRIQTDAQTHGYRRSHASPRPSLAVSPSHLETRGGDTRGRGDSRSEPRGPTDAQVGPTRTGAQRRRCTIAPHALVPTRAPLPRPPRSLACPALPVPPLSRCRYRSRFLLTGEEEEEEAEGGRPGPRPAWGHADTAGLRALLVSRSAPYGPNRAAAGGRGWRLRGSAAVLSRGEPGRDGGGVAKGRGVA